ncbi:MAG: hypothetical protein AAB890_03310 [Patescibacteria group bacterium]
MLKWSCPEFEYQEKNNTWFLIAIAVAVIIGLFALWQANFLFLIFIVIAALMVAVWSQKKPKTVNFMLDDRGLWIENIFYSFNKFDSFAIKPESLMFKHKERFKPYLIINFNKDDLEAIRKHLLDFFPEIEYNDSLIEAFTRLFKF